jgi:preprotein translocase subunit Sec63
MKHHAFPLAMGAFGLLVGAVGLVFALPYLVRRHWRRSMQGTK